MKLHPLPTFTEAAVVAMMKGALATALDNVCNGHLTEGEAHAALNDQLTIFLLGHVPNEWGVTLVPAAWRAHRVPLAQQAIGLMAVPDEAPVCVLEVEGLRDPDSIYNRVKAALAMAESHARKLRAGTVPNNANIQAITGREIAGSINAALNLLAISMAVQPVDVPAATKGTTKDTAP